MLIWHSHVGLISLGSCFSGILSKRFLKKLPACFCLRFLVWEGIAKLSVLYLGIKESDTGLAPPALWDLAADKQTLQSEQPLQVAR